VRIIHTADWHLCDRLGRIDRTRDLEQRVEVVARLCVEHAADVLLIAGDVFSEQASVDDMTRSLNHIRRTFRDFFASGGTILAITGNHDRDSRINMVRAGMTLAAPAAGHDVILPPGRMYLLNGRAVTTLQSKAGRRVQFVLVPYPFSSRYDLSATEYRSKEEENRLLHQRVAEWIQRASASDRFDATLPTVLTAHLHVRGSEAHSLYKLTERDDVLFDFGDLNPMWAYVALGHIHKPQTLGGADHVRYPGSLDRLDFGDTHDDHGVLLLEIDGTTAAAKPTRLPIPGTPFHTITLTDPESELPTLASQYPDHETAIVRFRVTPPTGAISRDEITRQLRRLFPRWHELKWIESETTQDDVPLTRFTERAGFETTVRDYLKLKLAGDPDGDTLLALAETFLTEGKSE
jgi:DNA repair protein SbcD/Mre11